MNAPTHLSEDATSASLNTEAHAVEHCAVDPASLDALESTIGRQLLIRQSGGRLALYTVTEPVGGRSRAVHVGTDGLTRLGNGAGAALEHTFNATVQAHFTDGDPQAPARLTEEALGDHATGLAIFAPHGGWIEVGTDDQARSVYDRLTRQAKPVRAWIARGFNPVTGAHRCWHITSSEISEHSFPKLGSFFASTGHSPRFAHAVAFHGHNDSEAIVVGGGLAQDPAHTTLKTELASRIQAALGALTSDPPAVEVRFSGPLAGALPSNIVNRVTARGNGIQVEQPLAVRRDEPQRDAIAHAVAAFYADLI